MLKYFHSILTIILLTSMLHYIIPNQKNNTKKEKKMSVNKSITKLDITNVLATGIAYFIVYSLLAWPTMLIWNTCLVPAVSIVKSISWVQTLGIMFLISLLTSRITKV